MSDITVPMVKHEEQLNWKKHTEYTTIPIPV